MSKKESSPTYKRLEDQISWYDRKSRWSQRWHHGLKILEIILAAIIPFLAGINAKPIITGGAGVLIVILEAMQHLFQFHNNWTNYRSTCENLRHEKYLWLAKAGPYLNIKNPNSVLADRIESLISQEHAKWIAGQEKAKQVKSEESV